MSILFYIAALAAGVWIFAYLYAFNFDAYSQDALVRLSFNWVSLIIFGLLGLAAHRSKKVSNPLLFATVGTLLGIAVLTVFVVLVFLS